MAESGLPSGPAPGGAGEVQVSLDELRAYVSEVLVPLEQRAHDAHAAFRGACISPQLIGPIAEATEFGARHIDGHQIYDPTMKALADDFSLLIEKLRKVMRNYEDEDANVAAALNRLAAKLSGDAGYQTSQVYEREVGEQVRASNGDGPGPQPDQASQGSETSDSESSGASSSSSESPGPGQGSRPNPSSDSSDVSF